MDRNSLNLLVICTANICRSPMAEAALRHAIAARGLRANVASAGVDALPGHPAHPISITTVARAGYGDISGHRSRQLSPRMAQEADFVLCMRNTHRDAIVARVPQAAGRTRLLGHWSDIEIDDPVSGPAEGFIECLERMDECIEEWVDRLQRQGLLQ